MTTSLRPDFLWGAATAAHQVEGNNLNNDFWRVEQAAAAFGYMETSGDALDSYHRYAEDMRLLADAGLNTYRFSLEWSRIEPTEGVFSRASLAHYRRMIDTALDLGLTPMVTLHHFTHPAWMGAHDAWLRPDAVELFSRYVGEASAILGGVEWVCTINEPNVLAVNHPSLAEVAAGKPYPFGRLPDEEFGAILVAAHAAAGQVVRSSTSAKVGWTVANQAYVAEAGAEDVLARVRYLWEDLYLEGSRGDDFVGVQSYTSQTVNNAGIVPHPEHPDNTLMGWAYRPDALGIAIRHTHEVLGGDVPIVVTENGIATDDDSKRIAYTTGALQAMGDAIADGIDVRGYIHWSLLDNFEWGHWAPTFGLVEVDRQTFERRPKPSLAWLGSVARRNGIPGS